MLLGTRVKDESANPAVGSEQHKSNAVLLSLKVFVQIIQNVMFLVVQYRFVRYNDELLSTVIESLAVLGVLLCAAKMSNIQKCNFLDYWEVEYYFGTKKFTKTLSTGVS